MVLIMVMIGLPFKKNPGVFDLALQVECCAPTNLKKRALLNGNTQLIHYLKNKVRHCVLSNFHIIEK